MRKYPEVSESQLRGRLAVNCTQLLAMSFAIDDDAKNLAANLGAQRLLDKMHLFDELIPAIRQLTGA
jgi:hypothetical protein